MVFDRCLSTGLEDLQAHPVAGSLALLLPRLLTAQTHQLLLSLAV